jgi:cobalt-zinc-cadmium efflux system outer membrane protein
MMTRTNRNSHRIILVPILCAAVFLSTAPRGQAAFPATPGPQGQPGVAANSNTQPETQMKPHGIEPSSTSSNNQSTTPASSSSVVSQTTQAPGRSLDASANLYVSPERTLSLRASFDKAVENNKEVIAARYNLPIAKAAIRIAGAIPNPRFSLLYGFGPAYTIIIAGNPQQFGLQQDIQTAGKRTKQVNLARSNYSLAELNVAALLFNVHNRVRRAYSEQAAAEAYELLIESERKVAFNLLDIAQKRYDSGKAPFSEALQAKLGVSQFDTQRNQAELRLQQASAALAQLVGETPKRVEVIDVDDNGIFKLSAEKTDLVPSPYKTLPPLNDLMPEAYQQRPDLHVAVQQAYSDRKALTLARAQRIPDVLIDAGYQFTTLKPHQPFGLTTVTVHNQPGAYLNVTAEFPIYYHHQGETTQAKGTWLQDYAQIEQLKTQVATDIVTAYEETSVARANIIKFQKELLPAAALVAKQALIRYQLGKSDLASAIIAKQQYQQTLSSYFDAVVSYQNSWADLENAIGVPLQL